MGGVLGIVACACCAVPAHKQQPCVSPSPPHRCTLSQSQGALPHHTCKHTATSPADSAGSVCRLHCCPGSDAWLISLGPLLAPAGSTLLLQLSYTAHFGTHKQGLWRSAPYPAPGAPGSEVVALASEFEMSAARTVLPCLDEPQYKVGGAGGTNSPLNP